MVKERIKKISIVALVVALMGVIVYALLLVKENDGYRQEISARDNEAFYSFMDDLDMLGTSLGKLSVGADSSMGLQLLADVWRQAGNAEETLSNINMGDETKNTLSTFINRVSDYAGQLLLDVGRGQVLTQQDKDQLFNVRETCASIYNKLTEAWAAGYTVDMDIDTYVLEETGATVDFVSEEYPRLIYDGAFSESLEDDPINLSLGEVSMEEALLVANEFFGAELTYSSITEGEQPFYAFSGESEYGNVEVYITKYGGLVLGFNTVADGGLEAIPTYQVEQKLIHAAKNYLLEKGWPECESGYIQYYNGNAVVNMVPLQDGVRLYADLIKVSVDMENFVVVAVDAINYVASHMVREIPEATVAYQTAKTMVQDLQITSTGMAVIPKDTGEEAYCYELFCTDGTDEFIVYVNATTGDVEDILQIVHINNGVLTK